MRHVATPRRVERSGPEDVDGTATDWSGTFRPDIEGLRGLAVIPVLLYHAAAPGWAGGYVGVDVFLVLSGYLITGLLARELTATGRISLAGFYARRSRRILPAAALVLVATVVASACLLPPVRTMGVAVDGVWAALFSANIHFSRQATDYLQAELAPSPLLHYWSLGVEEQFYLIWPALLLITVRGRADVLRRAGIVAGLVVVTSFALSLHLTATNIPWAFFSLPARAWELGIGALLAVVEMRGRTLPAGAATITGWVGLGLVAAAVAWFGAETRFPGTAALAPTLGAALLIAAGARPSRFAAGRLLATRLPRFVGRISYSLYLWSWPLIAIPAGAFGTPLGLAHRLALAALAIPLAVLTWRMIEQPLRRGRLIGQSPRRSLALAGVLTSVAVVVSLAAYGRTWRLLVADGAGSEPSARQETLVPLASGPLPADVRAALATAAEAMPRPYRDGCHLAQTATRFAPCTYGVPASPRSVVLFGDSHAAQWFPALERIAMQRSWRLLVRTKSACGAPDVPVWNSAFKREYVECAEWRQEVLRDLARERPQLVIVAGGRRVAAMADGALLEGADRAQAWSAGLERTIRRLTALGAAVVLIGDTPLPAGHVPSCLSAHLDDVQSCTAPRAHAIDEGGRARERDVAAATGATFIDPSDWVCPSDPCPPVISSRLVFRDEHHLGTSFVEFLAPRLAAALPP